MKKKKYCHEQENNKWINVNWSEKEELFFSTASHYRVPLATWDNCCWEATDQYESYWQVEMDLTIASLFWNFVHNKLSPFLWGRPGCTISCMRRVVTHIQSHRSKKHPLHLAISKSIPEDSVPDFPPSQTVHTVNSSQKLRHIFMSPKWLLISQKIMKKLKIWFSHSLFASFVF